VAVEAMAFHHPVKVGDEISIFAELLKIGNTSMHFQIETWRRSRDGDHTTKVTEAVFVFVAVDRSGRPRPVQKLSG
jgi:acyl-CoA thioesterase YciA